MKDYNIQDQRLKLSGIIEDFAHTAKHKIRDSRDVKRKVIFASEKTICQLAFGDDKETTEVEPNDFNATIVVFEGSAKIEFDNGKEELIDERNRKLFVPKQTGFKVTSISHGSAILTILDKL